eukprot:scpid54944/ scgid10774/ Frizzled-5
MPTSRKSHVRIRSTRAQSARTGTMLVSDLCAGKVERRLFGLLAVYLLLAMAVPGAAGTEHICTPLQTADGGAEALCNGLYNSTMAYVNGTLRRAVVAELNQFAGIILTSSTCHAHMPLFVCASFLPVCRSTSSMAGGISAHSSVLYPCDEFCSAMEFSCSDLFVANRFVWPVRFNCNDTTRYPRKADNRTDCLVLPPLPPSVGPVSTTLIPVTANMSGMGSRPCNGDYYFQAENRSFITLWIAIWSVLCLLSSLITVATFFMDRERFNYPEKPIVFLSLSYSIFSLAFIARLIAGDTVLVCSGSELVNAGTNSGPCTIIALLLYFSWMASYSWWLVLTLTWLLAAGFKWGTEAIAKHSTHFHIIAWGAPALKTLVLVATENVDADELARVCSVGNFKKSSLLGFVIIPISVYLAIGTLFIIIGIASLIRIRTMMKDGGRSTQKLEQLIVRIGILSVFYTGPASVVLGIYAHEYADRDHWRTHCTEPLCRPGCTGTHCDAPIFAVYVVKYFMLLVVGVTSSVWIWSGKTVASWKRFTRRLCRRKSRSADLHSRRVSHLSMEGS